MYFIYIQYNVFLLLFIIIIISINNIITSF